MCGGRNDLSKYFVTDSSSTSKSLDTSESVNTSKSVDTSNQTETFQSRDSTNISNQSISSIDWNKVVIDLLAYNPTDMCVQSYLTGSGDIKQTLMVNRTCRCVLFDQIFNSNSNLKDFGRLIRPLLYGKIYYHPSNVIYDNLIRQLNQTFESLDELIKLFRQMRVTILSTVQMISSLCDVVSNSSSICQQLGSYVTPLNLFTLVTEFTACTERNRFVAKASEADMVKDGQNNSATNSFLAAIKFLDDIPDNGGLPKHIRYKIRMALDYVDNTFEEEDR